MRLSFPVFGLPHQKCKTVLQRCGCVGVPTVSLVKTYNDLQTPSNVFLVRKFDRDLAKKKSMQGNKARGVQYVVRRVVTPFGVGLEERTEQLGIISDDLKQPRSSEGGQDSLLRGLGGNMSRQTRSSAVAG